MNDVQSPVKIKAASNIFTGLLAFACAAILAAAGFVSYKCWFDYETLFKITDYIR